MKGAIAGDILGSIYEFDNKYKTVGPLGDRWPGDFALLNPACFFTDDTVLTCAVMQVFNSYSLVSDTAFADALRQFGRKYPHCSYGGRFLQWLAGDREGDSLGNGAPMRVSPVIMVAGETAKAFRLAALTAVPSHSHFFGVWGAQSVAVLGVMLKNGEDITKYAKATFAIDLAKTTKGYYPLEFNERSTGTVEPAIRAAIEGSDWKDCIRRAIAMGGDTDTICAITGALAEARFGGIPEDVEAFIRTKLDDFLIKTIDRFYERYAAPKG